MNENSFLPQHEDRTALSQQERMPDYTHKMNIQKQRIAGNTDGLEALAQTVFHILSVERYRYNIYSQNYGVELEGLIGQTADYVKTEAKRRIADALMQDDRITAVENWSFQNSGKNLMITFIVRSVYGELQITKELDV